MRLGRTILIASAVGVAVLLVGVAGFLLSREVARFAKARGELEKADGRLRRYYEMKPFPTPENVAVERENGKALEAWADDILARLRKGQVEAVENRSPPRFMELLNVKLNFLREKRETAVPQGNWAAGFDRYRGVPPVPDHVPRLTQQLLMVESLCKVLFEERATEILSVTRDEFEGEPVDPAALPAGEHAPAPPPPKKGKGLPEKKKAGPDGALHDRFRFTVEFRAREVELLSILNRLARDPTFIVVTRLHIEKESPDVLTPAKTADARAEGAEAPAPPREDAARKGAREHPPHEERIVCGRPLEKPMKIGMELEIYTFEGKDNPGGRP